MLKSSQRWAFAATVCALIQRPYISSNNPIQSALNPPPMPFHLCAAIPVMSTLLAFLPSRALEIPVCPTGGIQHRDTVHPSTNSTRQ